MRSKPSHRGTKTETMCGLGNAFLALKASAKLLVSNIAYRHGARRNAVAPSDGMLTSWMYLIKLA
jgi:hypothetical protein